MILPKSINTLQKTWELGSKPRGHGETILVVEDNTRVLALAQEILEKLGYAVMTSNSPKEALNMARGYEGDIQMLLTE